MPHRCFETQPQNDVYRMRGASSAHLEYEEESGDLKVSVADGDVP